MTAYVSLIVSIVGALVYGLSSNTKVSEMGRLAFACGLLAMCFYFAGKMTNAF